MRKQSRERSLGGLLGLGRLHQEHVDGVPCLATEAGYQPHPSFMRPEQARVEPERPVPGRQVDPQCEGRMPASRGRIALFGVAGQGILERLRLLAAGGDANEVVVVEPDQRRLQGAGQGEIVGRQQPRPADGDEVVHRDMGGDVQAVLARHGHTAELQGADHLLECRRALPHQDEHVPGTPDAAALVSGRGPGLHRPRHPAGGDDGRRVGLWRVHRCRPGIGLLFLGGHFHRPDLHHPRCLPPGRLMRGAHGGIVEGQALVMLGHGEGGVHRAEDALRRAERQVQRHVLEG